MKALITATVQSHVVQFHRPLIELLHAHGYEVHVAAKNNLAEKDGIKLDFVERVFDVPFQRSPKSTDNFRAYKQLKCIIDDENYDIIHCNTPMGGVVTRLAARKARKSGTKVLYTAHGFHFYKGAPLKNWILYYPVESFFARLTDAVITINDEDYRLAAQRFPTKVFHIHGAGVSSKRYHAVSLEERTQLREKLEIPQGAFSILCVGELNRNKNQIMVIKAVEMLAGQYPQILLLIAGNGRLQTDYEAYIARHHLESNIRMLGYCANLEEYQRIADIGVSCSIREGLPFNIMETMLSGNAVIATANRGHNELIQNGESGYIIPQGNIGQLVARIAELIENPDERKRMGEVGIVRVQPYISDNVVHELEKIYEDVLKSRKNDRI